MDLRERLQRALGSAYLIQRELGQGGMATVLLAEDPKHERQVAVKVLRPELAAALGPERFTREIRIAARLQHPHILPLLDSGQADGFLYYVMPYVDGQSLRDRIARDGELPVHEAVRLLVEIVDALAFAHAQGIVHRDIKPDNVLLSGRHALVMDFGVAKAVSEATGRQSLTTAGVALGTPAYMAPEQATADPNLDHRVDIYAVGVMGYELLTGRTPFAGLSAPQMLAAHVTEEPAPLTRYRPSLSPVLQSVIMRCLAKHPADRWQTAQELLAQLEPLLTPSGGMTPTETRPVSAIAPARSRSTVLLAAATGAVALLAGAIVFAGRRSAPEEITLGRRTQVTLDPGLEIEPALSPDGRLVAYAAGPIGAMRLFVRQLEGENTIPITAGVLGDLRKPRWSPDGARIAYLSGRGIEVVPALGGRSRLLAEGVPPDTASDVAWSPDGTQIAYRIGDTLYRRAAEAKEPATVVTGAYQPHSPSWSSDGRWIAFVSGNREFASSIPTQFGNIAPSSIMVSPAEGGAPVPVTDSSSFNTSPMWLPGRRGLLFISDRDGGRDVYRIGLDATGGPTSKPERLTTGLNAASISISADGRRVAYAAFTQTANVFALPLPARGAIPASRARQVTSGNQLVENIDLSPDRKWLGFDTSRNGNQDIYKIAVGGGEPEQLTNEPQDDFLNSWSPDGREIAYHTFRNGNRDIYAVPASGGESVPVMVSPAQDRDGCWYPDGQRFLFASNRTGRFELYTQSRQRNGWGRPTQLSDDGGVGPSISPDGQRILFLHKDRTAIMPSAGGRTTDLSLSGPLVGRERGILTGAWAADGRGVLLAMTGDSTHEQQIWLMPLDGGAAPRLLVRLDDPRVGIGRGSMVARGGTLYFLLTRSESDIWTAELTGP
ncbi:MAG: protein kinase [Gemmatimonadales bacterium]